MYVYMQRDMERERARHKDRVRKEENTDKERTPKNEDEGVEVSSQLPSLRVLVLHQKSVNLPRRLLFQTQ